MNAVQHAGNRAVLPASDIREDTVGEKSRISASAQDRLARLEKIQVLLVNSSERALEVIATMFQQIGFKHVVTASNGEDAAFLMRQMRIDVVVVDDTLSKPVQPGTLAKGWEEATGIEFVDGVTTDRLLEARDAGVNEIVTKPLNAQEFCMRITHIFDKPRNFVTAPAYKGPCRRRRGGASPEGKERRVREVRLIRCDEMRGAT
jgi:two-component system chemotaxis response regulator CheY